MNLDLSWEWDVSLDELVITGPLTLRFAYRGTISASSGVDVSMMVGEDESASALFDDGWEYADEGFARVRAAVDETLDAFVGPLQLDIVGSALMETVHEACTHLVPYYAYDDPRFMDDAYSLTVGPGLDATLTRWAAYWPELVAG